ncbi:MAG: PD40 domain-containing protein [Chloroflexi bacterium]|nr:PD40 domain-containing protein [Chloroflexota bacterium]
MPNKPRKRGSSQASATTEARSNTGAVSGYMPATGAGRARRTAPKGLLWATGIVVAALLVWLALARFAPGSLPDLLRPQPEQTQTVIATSATGRICFVRMRDSAGNNDLFVVNPDGSNQQQVTQNLIVEGTDSWSPDGRRILLQAGINNISTVVRITVGADNKATEAVQLTADVKADSAQPVWSPDGTQIAFQSKREGGDWQVFIMDADGNRKRRISDGKNAALQPAWSPDGKSIAYMQGAAAQDQPKELYIAPLSGGAPKEITSLGKSLNRPIWSPDGKSIALYEYLDSRNLPIMIMNPDGTGLRTLVQGGAIVGARFSPSGDKLLYSEISTSTSASGTDIFTISPSGGTPTNLTPNSAEDYQPAWSPDGSYIAWSGRQGGVFKIVLANADGSNPQTLTKGDDYQPSWGVTPR